MYLHSISAHVDEIFDKLDPSSFQVLRNSSEAALARLHHGWGTSIRNEYGFWKPDHPLTKNWHAYPDNRDIRDGADYSMDHPDRVSYEIMKGVWKKVNA